MDLSSCIIVVTGSVHSLRNEVAERIASHFGITHFALPAILEADLVEAQLYQRNSVELQRFIDKKLIDEARAALARDESLILSGPLSPSSAVMLSSVVTSNSRYRGVEISCIQTDDACCFMRFESFCKERRIELPENAFTAFTSRVLRALPVGRRRYDNWEQYPIKEETLDTVQFSGLFAKIARNQPVGV